MYQVSAEKIEDSDCYRIDIFDDDELVAGILTYETDKDQAMSHAKGLISHYTGEKKRVAYIPVW